MANQGIMVPPNNAPWPGQKPVSPSLQPQQQQPPPPMHHPYSASTSPYPSQYYQQGHPPPPHATSPQQPPQPYYPYPYAYPPHAYPHGHPPPPHPGYPHPGYHAPYYQPPLGPVDTSQEPSETLSVSSISTKASKADATSKTKAKSSSLTTKPKAKAKTTEKASTDPKAKVSTKAAPKTFRFEGSISSESFKTTKSFDLAGVNILNRKPLDTRTALDKLQRRRETHNRLIDDLTKLLPPKHLEETSSKCHRVNVLRGAVSHIKFLNESNQTLTKSIQAIQGDAPLVTPKIEPSSSSILGDDRMSMDVDQDDDMRSSVMDDDDDETQGRSIPETPASSSVVSSSRSTPTTSPRLTPAKAMAPPPVIITGAPSPSSERDSLTVRVDPYSLQSHRQRSNSFASSIGDEGSPSPFPTSPMFPPSPVSPAMTGRNLLAPESQGEGSSKDTQLSPGFHPAGTSPSLPPISSLANLHLQTPSGRNESQEREPPLSGPSDTVSSFSGRPHRAGATLPPLMIPEPHHLHPYHQGTSASNKGSNRNSLTLSPHPPTSPRQNSDQPPISPFMLSPMLSRSPSMGPATSPALSPHSQWGHDGLPSPLGFGQNSPYSSPYYYPPPGADLHQGYHYPHSPQHAPSQHQQSEPSPIHTRPKSLQPEPIFIQEEPWNTQRKRSTSSVSGKASFKSKKKEPEDRPVSPALSSMSYPTSPNPKKRPKAGEGDADNMTLSQAMASQASTNSTIKRSKQVDAEMDEVSFREVKVEGSTNDDEDAAQALTSLARTS
ncbi:hypothetical protein BGZ59_006321 [Podila verticillata]|nr:hypothetical protein BGZ59_006321 [Podila verticillata]